MIALATTAIGWVILVLSLLGWVGYYLGNRRAAQPELGSEVGMHRPREAENTRRVADGSRSAGVKERGQVRLVADRHVAVVEARGH